MRNAITIIKLGGSIITDKSRPYIPNLPVLKRLAREIKKSGVPVIIVHGAGSFAHTSAKKYGGKKGYSSQIGISRVFNDAIKINNVVVECLISKRLPAISFRPNSLFVARGGKMKYHNLDAVLLSLKQELIPVLYGDVILDEKWKTTIFSGETIILHLVLFLQKKDIKVEKVIQVGRTDGVQDENGKTIRQISLTSFKKYKKTIFGSNETDVTGGMLHKVEVSLVLAKGNVPTSIISGLKKNELYNSLVYDTNSGTLIHK